MPVEGDDAQALEAEARMLARYLVGRPAPPEVVARYCDANRTLLDAPPEAGEAAMVAFVRRRPWALPLLDAAAALRRPAGLLRSKALVMTAILETTPELADEFLPRHVHPLGLLLRLALSGTLAVLLAAAGLLLLPLVLRGRA
jgi:hypothetical protein